jgi:brefeldin A-resistance guanine nucleotide exchange factor 1
LNAFIDLHDFSGRFVVDALRDLLSVVRLPGEAPLIGRILTSFSNKYIKDHEPALLDIIDMDCMFVLTSAIIMLNTSLYNPSIKAVDLMPYEDSSKNLRGLNAGNHLYVADGLLELSKEDVDSTRSIVACLRACSVDSLCLSNQ